MNATAHYDLLYTKANDKDGDDDHANALPHTGTFMRVFIWNRRNPVFRNDFLPFWGHKTENKHTSESPGFDSRFCFSQFPYMHFWATISRDHHAISPALVGVQSVDEYRAIYTAASSMVVHRHTDTN